MNKIFYTVYKVTNKINGKFYIGVHKTTNLNDDYLGSGKLIKRAIIKYGKNSFQKEILFVFDNSLEMYLKEKEILTEEFLESNNTYNLRIGGFGGWDYLNNDPSNPTHSKEHLSKMMSIRISKFPNGTTLGVRHTEKSKKLIGIKSKNNKSFSNRKHSPETIDKMKKSAKNRGLGNKNSQYGTVWMYHLQLGNKKVKLSEIDEYLNLGWIRGRKIT